MPNANGSSHRSSATDADPGTVDAQLDPYALTDDDVASLGAPGGGPASAKETRSDDGAEFSALDLRDRVVIMLIYYETVTTEDVERAWRTWKTAQRQGSKEPLWRVVAEQPGVDVETIYKVAAQVYAFEEAKIIKPAVLALMRELGEIFEDDQMEQLAEYQVVPVSQTLDAEGLPQHVVFATHDPTRPDLHRYLQQLKLERFELQYAPLRVVQELITASYQEKNKYLDRLSEDPMAYDLGANYQERESDLIDEEALEAEISRSTLINLFEATLVEAVRQGVSDIHIYPNPKKQVEIHFRMDGELRLWYTEERVHPESFLAVVKDNSTNVDRFERDAAQDGFIQRRIDGTLIRFRVSILPIANANQELRSESIVIRVLDDRKVITDLRKLGLIDQAMERFEEAIHMPYGMVILTGPTGSGKTTTLFAAMHQVVTPKVNVLTVEDPVEYIIPGVRQIKLNHKLNLEQAMRAILRHDPDVVMVGEMRDKATAELAIKLANTGHLTFSTLHTNDAPSAVSRLYKMGLEPFLIAYAINLVVAQRLIRKLCPECKRPAAKKDPFLLNKLGFSDAEIEALELMEPGKRPDCPKCRGVGYKGRRAVTETMLFSDEIRTMIIAANDMIDEARLRDQAVAEGMLTLRMAAREVVKDGETSLEELVRVTAG